MAKNLIYSACLFFGNPTTIGALTKFRFLPVLPELLFSVMFFVALMQKSGKRKIVGWLIAVITYYVLFRSQNGAYGLGAVALMLEFLLTTLVSICFLFAILKFKHERNRDILIYSITALGVLVFIVTSGI
jgi:hypothetical protein